MRSKKEIFKQGSTTYYYSSLFFPPRVRDEVFTLYAYVRVVDDLVDTMPADREGFYKFVDMSRRAFGGERVGMKVIDELMELALRRGFEWEWIEAFLEAMESDLGEVDYQTMEELNRYMYGSAEVVGLMMARILGLPREAETAAKLQGRAMQFMNFIRDVEEDRQLGRVYMPQEDREQFGIGKDDFSEDKWSRLLSFELERYRQMQEEADEGFSYIPWRYRVPIAVAAEMYWWTGEVIERNPGVVWRRKVKPSPIRVVTAFAKHLVLGGRSAVGVSGV